MKQPTWKGVFPAATTQFAPDMTIDFESTQKQQAALLDEGVDGLILLGTCGENNSLEPDEKRQVLKSTRKLVNGRVPILAGVSELTTDRAVAYARDAAAIGVDGLMVLPAMVYVPTSEELYTHFKSIAEATSLPIMLYNNPPAYRVSIEFDVLEKLAKIPNIVAIKESAVDLRRFTDLINRFGDRFDLFAGLDDVALEALVLGACGWVSGLTNVFAKESLALFQAAKAKDLDKALQIYRWFMPLLHLDAEHDLVQAIKLAAQVTGRGTERVRMPRLPLSGARREEVLAIVERANATRASLPI